MKLSLVCCSVFLLVYSGFGVKITSLKMPSPYVLYNTEKYQKLVLDCVYDEEKNERGLVLKWFFNYQLIYQWIPDANKRPTATNLFKNIITTVENKNRAIEILNPTLNMSGTYSCSVQTFQSVDIKYGKLQMIVPESRFHMNYEKDTTTDLVHIHCHAVNIYPEPFIQIFIGDQKTELDVVETILTNKENQLKNMTVEGKIHRKLLKSPTNIFCILSLSVYVKKLQRIFYDSPLPSVAETICTERDKLGHQVKIWRINNAESLRLTQQWLILLPMLVERFVGNKQD